MSERTETIKVWDPLVRIGHWLLVTAFFVAYLSEDDFLTLHVWAGYTVTGIILFRVLWGFTGTENARFRSFVRAPKATLRYLADIGRNRAQRYVGHNPAGGAMIVAMLVFLAVTVFSGLEIYAIEENAGPLAGFAAADTDSPSHVALIATAQASDEDEGEYREDEAERDEEFWEEVHEVSANFMLFLILLHVAGVVLASISHRENLVAAMLNGRKRA